MNRHQFVVFAVTYLTYAVVYITRKAFSVVKTLIQDDLDLSAYTLGTIDSVFLGTYATFQIFLPSLSDQFGVRPVLISSLGLAMVCAAIFGGSSSSKTLIIAWLFEGIAHSSMFAVLVKSVSLWFPPEERGKILGVWTTSQQIGAMVATALITYISTTFGWRIAFFVASLATGMALFTVWWKLPEPPELYSPASQTSDEFQFELAPISKRRKIVSPSSPRCDPVPHIIVNNAPQLSDGEQNLSINETNLATVSISRSDSLPSSNFDTNNIAASTENKPIGLSQYYENKDEEKLGLTATTSGFVGDSKKSGKRPLATSPQLPMTFLQVLFIPNLIHCGMAYFCVKLVRYALLFWLPYFLITELDFKPNVAGYSSMMFDIGGIFGAVASGYISDRCFRGRRFMTAAVMCIATAMSLGLFSFAARLPYSDEIDFYRPAQLLPTHLLNNNLLHNNQTALDGSLPFLNKISISNLETPKNIVNEKSKRLTGLGKLRRILPEIKSKGAAPTEAVVINNLKEGDELPPVFGRTLFLMALVGFFIAGPDSVLGAASASAVCERSGRNSALLSLSTATGLVNGMGSFGGVAQGYVTAWISESFGWSCLFLILGGTSLLSVVAMWPSICIELEMDALPTSLTKSKAKQLA